MLSIFLRLKSAKDGLKDKMGASDYLYPSDLLCQKNIIKWSLNLPGKCSNKVKKALIIKKDKDKHNFRLEKWMEEKLILVLGLFSGKRNKNL